VQECIAESNYRWQNEAVAAWNRGQSLPARSEQRVMQECMKNAATELITENEALKRRVVELDAERQGLAAVAQQEREHLRSSQDRMTDALGEAAKKPAPNAFATANSTGTASTQSDQTAAPGTPVNISTPAVPIYMPERPVVVPAPAPKVKPQGAVPTCAPPARGKKMPKGNTGRTQCIPAPELAAKQPSSVLPVDQK
jgi:hypothetical protein